MNIFENTFNTDKDLTNALMDILGISDNKANKLLSSLSLTDISDLSELLKDNISAKNLKKWFLDKDIQLESINTINRKITGDTSMTNKLDGTSSFNNVPTLTRILQLSGANVKSSDHLNEDEFTGGAFDDSYDDDLNNYQDEINDLESKIDSRISSRQEELGDMGDDMDFDDDAFDNDPMDNVASSVSINENPYDDILAKLDEIRLSIPNIKLSEFKPLLTQFESLVSELRNSGVDALKESTVFKKKELSETLIKFNTNEKFRRVMNEGMEMFITLYCNNNDYDESLYTTVEAISSKYKVSKKVVESDLLEILPILEHKNKLTHNEKSLLKEFENKIHIECDDNTDKLVTFESLRLKGYVEKINEHVWLLSSKGKQLMESNYPDDMNWSAFDAQWGGDEISDKDYTYMEDILYDEIMENIKSHGEEFTSYEVFKTFYDIKDIEEIAKDIVSDSIGEAAKTLMSNGYENLGEYLMNDFTEKEKLTYIIVAKEKILKNLGIEQ